MTMHWYVPFSLILLPSQTVDTINSLLLCDYNKLNNKYTYNVTDQHYIDLFLLNLLDLLDTFICSFTSMLIIINQE